MNANPLLTAFFANPLVAVVLIDCNDLIQQANPAFLRLVGYSTDDLHGRRFATLCASAPPAAPPPATSLAGQPVQQAFVTASGREVWGEMVRMPLDGVMAGELILIHDCTRMHYEQQLYQGRAAVLEQLYRDADLQEVCAEIVAYIESVAKGVYCSILLLDPASGTLHKAAAPSLPDFYNQAIDGMRVGDGIGSCGTAAFRGERVIVADILNHPYWERARRLVERTSLRSCWSEPIFGRDRQVLGTFALYYTSPREPNSDELDLIRSAAELTALAINHKRAEAALLAADRTKDEFISTAAHELNTPLTTLLGYTELLADAEHHQPLAAAERQEYLQEILTAGERMQRLIDDLFDLGKIRSGAGLSMDKQPVTLRPVIDKVLRPLTGQAPRHTFRVIERGVVPAVVVCDEWRLRQLLENLLNNAVKYSPAGGEISLTLHADPRLLHVTISDQGIGMSPEQVERAFDKFYRASGPQAAVGGLGLGLPIARHIVTGHGGTIRLESHPGSGTQVHFSLALE